jgi:hypothetical protein
MDIAGAGAEALGFSCRGPEDHGHDHCAGAGAGALGTPCFWSIIIIIIIIMMIIIIIIIIIILIIMFSHGWIYFFLPPLSTPPCLLSPSFSDTKKYHLINLPGKEHITFGRGAFAFALAFPLAHWWAWGLGFQLEEHHGFPFYNLFALLP